MTKQQSIARVSTATVDRTTVEYPKAAYRACRYIGTTIVGNSPTKKIITVERGTVQIAIDIEALVDWMAHRALATKSGKSNMQDGLVVARVLKREPLSKETVDLPCYDNAEWV